jgi:hypothetical protein
LLARIEGRLGEGVLAPDAIFAASRFSELAGVIEAGIIAAGVAEGQSARPC